MKIAHAENNPSFAMNNGSKAFKMKTLYTFPASHIKVKREMTTVIMISNSALDHQVH